jgi:hypothetical protein
VTKQPYPSVLGIIQTYREPYPVYIFFALFKEFAYSYNVMTCTYKFQIAGNLGGTRWHFINKKIGTQIRLNKDLNLGGLQLGGHWKVHVHVKEGAKRE